jgi:hypothetical protein
MWWRALRLQQLQVQVQVLAPAPLPYLTINHASRRLPAGRVSFFASEVNHATSCELFAHPANVRRACPKNYLTVGPKTIVVGLSILVDLRLGLTIVGGTGLPLAVI